MKKLVVVCMLAGIILACGKKGDRGLDGLTGATGPTGSPGSDGQSCTAFKTGTVTTLLCPGSAPVAINDGVAGTPGTNGAPGVAGTPGTVITPVKFCAGVTAVYPSTFPEYGLIIGGVMYGVYSQNSGFLAALPPGTYNSNAVGSNCNFIINADNTITN